MMFLLKTACLSAALFAGYVFFWHGGRLFLAWIENRRIRALLDQYKDENPNNLDDW